MKRAILLTSALFILAKTFGQKQEKVFLDKADTTRNCYTIFYPEKLPWKGYMLLIPGFGETAERVLQQTTLPVTAASNGILTIIPTLQDGVLSFGVDSLSQQSLLNMLNDVTARHKLADQRFYIGGFSIGGSAAVKYAEQAAQQNRNPRPAAVFAIDPPLDFERFYNSCKRDVRLSVSSQPSQENVYMIGRLEALTGGTAQTAKSKYYQLSPYSFSDTTQSAIKWLVHTPLRLYAEPDVNWWIKERGSDFSAMNVLDGSAMINELNRLGNDKAAIITTQNKGYRKPDNKRHPHSWSIADNDELIQWLLQQQ